MFVRSMFQMEKNHHKHENWLTNNVSGLKSFSKAGNPNKISDWPFMEVGCQYFLNIDNVEID